MFFSDVSPATFALLMLPALINIWGISHAARHSFPRENERALWIAACIFLPVIGGVLYLIFGLRRSEIIIYDNNEDDNKNNDGNIKSDNNENINNKNNKNNGE